jgi:hypothetical protein
MTKEISIYLNEKYAATIAHQSLWYVADSLRLKFGFAVTKDITSEFELEYQCKVIENNNGQVFQIIFQDEKRLNWFLLLTGTSK